MYIQDLRHKIFEVVASVTRDIMVRFWEELKYRIDVCHMTRGAVCKVFKKLGEIFLSLCMRYMNIIWII
jgi:hypothetical protein